MTRPLVYSQNPFHWIERVAFSRADLTKLLEVCEKRDFVEAVAKVAELYQADLALGCGMSTACERDILADFRAKVKALRERANELPQWVSVDIQTQAFSRTGSFHNFGEFCDLLLQVEIDTVRALQDLPPTKSGRQATGFEVQAAANLGDAFRRFDIPFTTTISSSNLNPAVVCLRIALIAGGGDPEGLSESSLIKFIAKSKHARQELIP